MLECLTKGRYECFSWFQDTQPASETVEVSSDVCKQASETVEVSSDVRNALHV